MVMAVVARAAPELVGKVIATSAALHDKQPRQLRFTLKRIAANEVANRPGPYRARHDQTKSPALPTDARPARQAAREITLAAGAASIHNYARQCHSAQPGIGYDV